MAKSQHITRTSRSSITKKNLKSQGNQSCSSLSVMHTFFLVFLGLILVYTPGSASITGSFQYLQTCTANDSTLNPNTYEYNDACHNNVLYCADNNTCLYRGCRRDQFPFGYGNLPEPPLCGLDSFCPDRMNSCMPLIPLGGSCEFARDDECQTSLGVSANNFSICLNQICYAANVTTGQQCVIENTTYYDSAGSPSIVIRDNCINPGLYCDTDVSPNTCKGQKSLGTSCQSNRECITNTCSSNQCANPPETPRAFPTWVYVIVGIGIILIIVLICVALFYIHQSTRKRRRAKVDQYYQEQIAFRNSIISMHSAARSSLYSLQGSPHTPGAPMGDKRSHSPISLNPVGSAPHTPPFSSSQENGDYFHGGRSVTPVPQKSSGLRNVQKPTYDDENE